MKRLLVTLLLAAAALVAVLAGFGSPGRADARQAGAVWNAEFYDNPYLLGQPVITRQLTGLGQNWGLGSPGPGIPNDSWSARFAADPYFSAGTYRFYVLADDGVKLWIDFPPDKRPTLDTYNAPQPGQLLTADVTLSEGRHHIQVDFRENQQTAYLYVSWESLADGVQGPDFPTPIFTNVQWTATYYNNINLSGIPVVTQSEPTPTHYWGYDAPAPGVPADYFSARWVVYQQFDAGTYAVEVRADDGVRVYVDGQLLIDQWHGATGETYRQTFQLNQGNHSIVVEYYEATLIASLEVSLERVQAFPQPTQAPPPTPIPASPTPLAPGTYATVTASLLNVRSTPDPVNGQVITQIRRGEQYLVLGTNPAGTWLQLRISSGVVGWVNAGYVTLSAGPGFPTAIPPTVAPPQVYQCPGFLPSRLKPGDYGRVTPGLANNLRSQPSSVAGLVGQIPAGGIFYVAGGPVCATNTAWYQVTYRGMSGWTPEGDRGVYWLEPYWSPR